MPVTIINLAEVLVTAAVIVICAADSEGLILLHVTKYFM